MYRCRCCNALDTKFDGVDWYCEECLDAIDALITEEEDYEDVEWLILQGS